MAGQGKKWLIGCGVGCGGFILLIIAITVGGGFWMARPMNDAAKAQKELTAKYGARDAYVPPPGGVTADRMEVFLGVRRALAPHCGEFESLSADFRKMEELDQTGDEVSKKEAFKAVTNMMGSVMGLAGRLGQMSQTRNQALLDGGMSHGEYIWIYVLAYHSWLGHPPGTTFDSEGGQLSTSERKVVRRLMRNHVEALRAVGDTAGADLWQGEIRRMERSEVGVPFFERDLPADLVGVFAPLEERLRASFCPWTAGFELTTIRKKGLSFQAD